MKYLLIISCLLFTSVGWSNDDSLNLKSIKDIENVEFNTIRGFLSYVNATHSLDAYLFLQEVSKKLENKSEYKVIKKGSFIMIKDKNHGLAYFGNEKIIIESEDLLTYQSVSLLIDKPINDFMCIDYVVPDWGYKKDWEIDNFPLVRLRDYNKEHNLYIIPYFSSLPSAVVIAIGSAGNHGGGHQYMVFDINTNEYAILGPSKECGEFPPSIVNRGKN